VRGFIVERYAPFTAPMTLPEADIAIEVVETARARGA
jgi:hypothetical protein